MLSNKKIIICVANILSKINKNIPIVLDPVMVAKGGYKLLAPGAEETLIQELMPLCNIITPNIPEAEVITGIKINNIKVIIVKPYMLIFIKLKYFIIIWVNKKINLPPNL